MKKIYFTIIVLSIGFSCWAQNKAVNLEDIWKNYSFYPEYIWNLESMKNGAYYTQVDRSDNGSKLNKYSYRTGKRFSTIADSEKLGIAIENYTFSAAQHINLVSKVGGFILLITGFLILTNQLQALGFYLLNILPFVQNFG